jgi:hypothetical protein
MRSRSSWAWSRPFSQISLNSLGCWRSIIRGGSWGGSWHGNLWMTIHFYIEGHSRYSFEVWDVLCSCLLESWSSTFSTCTLSSLHSLEKLTKW